MVGDGYCTKCAMETTVVLGRCAACWGARPMETVMADVAHLAKELANTRQLLGELEGIRERYDLLKRAVDESEDECSPNCDRYGHADDCRCVNPAAWLEDQQAEIERLRHELEKERKRERKLRGIVTIAKHLIARIRRVVDYPSLRLETQSMDAAKVPDRLNELSCEIRENPNIDMVALANELAALADRFEVARQDEAQGEAYRKLTGLRAHQDAGWVHPLTCRSCSERDEVPLPALAQHGEVVLVCPSCGHVQREREIPSVCFDGPPPNPWTKPHPGPQDEARGE